MNMNLFTLYSDNKKIVWSFILIGIPVFLSIGSLLFPHIFWDSFLWKYFWGPLAADARERPIHGVQEGYNVVNTLVYGIALVIAFGGIMELIEHFDVTVDRGFVLSLLPWIVLGGSLRSLEDVGLFPDKVRPLFISPLIYFLLGISAIVLLVLGSYLRDMDTLWKRDVVRTILLYLPLPIFFSLGLPKAFVFSLVSIVTLSGFFIYGHKKDRLNERYLFLSIGSGLLALSLTYNAYFVITGTETNPWELVIIPIMALGSTALLIAVVKGLDTLSERNIFTYFSTPLNVILIFSHLFDGSATVRGMQAYGYVEKHVLPRFLIELTGTPLVMIPAKMVLIVLIIYVLDFLYREEMEEMMGKKNLLKFVIIVLGAAPAVRNTMRLAMGV